MATGAMAMGAPLSITPALGRPMRITDNRIFYGHEDFAELQAPRRPDVNSLKARLMANENPHGPSPKALQAFKDYAKKGNYYAWNILMELIGKIAEQEGVGEKNIMMGPGSSDLLEKTALVSFMNGKGNVVSGDPPYMSLINVARSVGAQWKAVHLTKDYQHDLKQMEKAIDAETKLVYITNPNNPTATLTDYKALRKFCAKVSEKVPVFVDEAYLDLSDKGLAWSMAPLVAEGKDVIVSRTFSKLHGMAGMRVGYIVGLESTLNHIQEITRGGMGITGPSIMAAHASLGDLAFQEKSKTLIKEAREFTCDMLKSKDIDFMPSQTNFVMFPLEMDGDQYLEKMYEQLVAVRVFKFWGKTWSRVSMGSMEEMKVFAQAFEKTVG